VRTWIGVAVALAAFYAALIRFGVQKRRAERNAKGQQILQFVRTNGPVPLSEFTADDGPELDAIVHQLHQQGRIYTRSRAGRIVVFPTPGECSQ
jgi:predicted transcriptional regulator